MAAIFKSIFLNEIVSISIIISLKFIPKGPINNIPALVQIMEWHLPSDKPLSDDYFTDAYMRHSDSMSWRFNTLNATLTVNTYVL